MQWLCPVQLNLHRVHLCTRFFTCLINGLLLHRLVAYIAHHAGLSAARVGCQFADLQFNRDLALVGVFSFNYRVRVDNARFPRGAKLLQLMLGC